MFVITTETDPMKGWTLKEKGEETVQLRRDVKFWVGFWKTKSFISD